MGNESGELQMEKFSNGLYTEYNSGGLQLKNVSGR